MGALRPISDRPVIIGFRERRWLRDGTDAKRLRLRRCLGYLLAQILDFGLKLSILLAELIY